MEAYCVIIYYIRRKVKDWNRSRFHTFIRFIDSINYLLVFLYYPKNATGSKKPTFITECLYSQINIFLSITLATTKNIQTTFFELLHAFVFYEPTFVYVFAFYVLQCLYFPCYSVCLLNFLSFLWAFRRHETRN